MKNKKIIIILSVVIILAIIGVIWLVIANTNEKTDEQIEEQEEAGVSILTDTHDKLLQSSAYTFKLTLNDENNMTVTKKNDKASVEIVDEGEKSTYIVNNNNTYLLIDNTKKYYTYQNNTAYLTKITDNMENLLEYKFSTGKETIDNKEYRYEEFEKNYPFILNYKTSIDPETTKTRVYFDGNNLKYIKTYVGEVEQLLKVEMSFDNVNDNKFEIPKEYEEG